MEFKYIRYEIDEGVASIVLNRPDKLNALNSGMIAEMEQSLQAAEQDMSVGAIVLRGEGRCFSSGADMSEKSNVPDVESVLARHRSPGSRYYWSIWESSKPVIASVHSYCLAGALWIVHMCDLAIASEDAVFGNPAVRFAQHPGIHPPTLAMKHAKELAITGKRITAERAERMGLVNAVVPLEDLHDETYKLARHVAALPRIGVGFAKRHINRIYEAAGYPTLADLGSELLTYANALQALAGSDGGYRERIREVGVAQASKERDERLAAEGEA